MGFGAWSSTGSADSFEGTSNDATLGAEAGVGWVGEATFTRSESMSGGSPYYTIGISPAQGGSAAHGYVGNGLSHGETLCNNWEVTCSAIPD